MCEAHVHRRKRLKRNNKEALTGRNEEIFNNLFYTLHIFQIFYSRGGGFLVCFVFVFFFAIKHGAGWDLSWVIQDPGVTAVVTSPTQASACLHWGLLKASHLGRPRDLLLAPLHLA